VEHLANLYSERGKPIIPLDLPLGASRGDNTVGGEGLAKRALVSPDQFFRLKVGDPAARLAALSTVQGTDTEEIARRLIALIEDITLPRAFYVRLLDTSSGDFDDVEWFFRNVVDHVVAAAGYETFEMGRDVQEAAWMNEEIFRGLYFSSLVIVDLTGHRPNCFTELGYALGRGQKLLVTARERTATTFDLDKIPWHFWSTDDASRGQAAFRDYVRLNVARPPLVVVAPLV
jgi:hypothetical protein